MCDEGGGRGSGGGGEDGGRGGARAPLHVDVLKDEALGPNKALGRPDASAVAVGRRVGDANVFEPQLHTAVLRHLISFCAGADPAAVPGRCAVDEVDILHQEHRARRRVDDAREPLAIDRAPAPRPTILTPRNEGMTSSLPPSLKVVPSSSSITLMFGQSKP